MKPVLLIGLIEACDNDDDCSRTDGCILGWSWRCMLRTCICSPNRLNLRQSSHRCSTQSDCTSAFTCAHAGYYPHCFDEECHCLNIINHGK